MMTYPRRLIEVDLPIARISAHARREKSIRHGHISTLHIWWARRPLAACRAVVCASLWPDPDELESWLFTAKKDGDVGSMGPEIRAPLGCKPTEGVLIRPARFLDEARSRMQKWATHYGGKCSAESMSMITAIQKDASILDEPCELRKALLDFIADFANWDNSTDAAFLETARALTQAAHEALGGEPGSRPLVVDPFAGGGSIPLEALRVGADAFASDLNPVAVLLNKIVLEYIPKYGQKLADEVRKWGRWTKKQAEKELAQFYPKDTDGATPIAYLWARTVRCEGPNCGAEIPLKGDPWVRKKTGQRIYLRFDGEMQAKKVEISLVSPDSVISSLTGTVKRSSATCPVCGYTTPAARVRAQFKSRRGGADDARLLVVVSLQHDGKKVYREPTGADIAAFGRARSEAARRLSDPDFRQFGAESLPYLRSIFNIHLLGVTNWIDLLNCRQRLMAWSLCESIRHRARKSSARDADFDRAVAATASLVIDRLIDSNSSLCWWVNNAETCMRTFGRQAMPIVWDYVESNILAPWGRGVDRALEIVSGTIDFLAGQCMTPGTVEQCSADALRLPDDCCEAFITDPPYYDSIPYADLSDFYYVWLKRMVGEHLPLLFETELTPKKTEIVQLAERNPIYSYKTKENYERMMTLAMREGRRASIPSGICVVVFAHKSTGGWESQLQAMVDAGWVVTASWPIDTESARRLRAQNAAVLGSSVHLVCRPRENPDGSVRDDDVGEWREVLAELPQRIHAWMPRLADEGVVGADAIFACLGPALEIFSRYSRVEKASGDVVMLGEYLEHVWAAVSKEALSMLFADADAGGLEPDARLTAMWLWTLGGSKPQGNGDAAGDDDEDDDEEDAGDKKKASKAAGGFTLEFDAARKIAQGLGAHLDKLPSVVEVKGDKARLLGVSERTRHLFGKDAEAGGTRAKRKKKKPEPNLFAEMDAIEEEAEEAGWSVGDSPLGQTVLDRVHQSMILFAAGRGEALRRFLVEDGAGKDARFWKLAQSLSALYPSGTDEKRWVDGVLGRKKGLGV